MAWFGSMCRWGDGVGISCKAELQFHIPNSFLQLVLFDTLFFHVSFFKCFLVVQWAKVNGVWSWQAVHAAGGVHVKLPYDCHAGLKNWHIGWSAPKKAWKGCGRLSCIRVLHQYRICNTATCVLCWPSQAWCCSHNQLGCEGGAGANVDAMALRSKAWTLT